MGLSEQAKERLGMVFEVAKTVFHWGFIPTVLYLGTSRDFSFRSINSYKNSFPQASRKDPSRECPHSLWHRCYGNRNIDKPCINPALIKKSYKIPKSIVCIT